MENLHRRTVMAAGTALVAGGSLASIGAADDCGCPSDLEDLEEPASGWSSYGGNPANGRYIPSENDIAKPDTVAWEYDKTGDLAVVDDTVYLRTSGVYDESPEVHAIDDANGDVRWINDEIPVDGTPAVAGGTVYVGGEQLTALDAADGSIRWEREFEYEPFDGEYQHYAFPVTSPTVAYGRVYVVVDGSLYALDPTDGSTDWKRETIEGDDSDSESKSDDGETVQFETKPVAVANQSVYVVTEDGEAVIALDAKTGDEQWTVIGPVISGPLEANDTGVYGSDPGAEQSIVFDTETGERSPTGGWIGGATVGEIRASIDRMGVYVDHYSSSREQLWHERYGHEAIIDGGSTAIVGDTLIVTSKPTSNPDEDRTVAAYNLEDGSVKWQITRDDDLDVAHLRAATSDTLYDFGGRKLRALRSVDEDEADESGDDDDDENAGDDSGSNESEDEEGSGTDGDGDDEGSDADGDENSGADGDENSDGDGNDEDSDADSDENDEDTASDENDDGDANDTDESDESDADGSGDGDTNGSENSSDTDTDGGEDGSPGFTPVAGLTGGAVTLEWLRRRALGDDDELEQD